MRDHAQSTREMSGWGALATPKFSVDFATSQRSQEAPASGGPSARLTHFRGRSIVPSLPHEALRNRQVLPDGQVIWASLYGYWYCNLLIYCSKVITFSTETNSLEDNSICIFGNLLSAPLWSRLSNVPPSVQLFARLPWTVQKVQGLVEAETFTAFL